MALGVDYAAKGAGQPIGDEWMLEQDGARRFMDEARFSFIPFFMLSTPRDSGA